LTLNCGGSSLKVRLVALPAEFPPGHPAPTVAEGTVAHIGADSEFLLALPDGNELRERVEVADHRAATRSVLERFAREGLLERVRQGAVGHRVVHGGARLVAPTPIDDEMLAALRQLERLAPLHNRPAVEAIRAAREVLGADVPQVAVFDTAFHHDMPAAAARYAIPKALTDRHEIRRFGFHGLAHRWMSERSAARSGVPVTQARLVTLQLGNGCSAAAIDAGRSVDTTMGFTPLEGLMMGTRSGDVDPALVGFLARREGTDVDTVEGWLNHESGLLGVSGRSRSMRVVGDLAASGDEDAALAVEMFCYRVRKSIGAYLAVLGGADAVVFGGGIGEHRPEVRRRICAGLQTLGIQLDDERNEAARGTEATISADNSPVRVEVLPVDEASVIARDTALCVAGAGATSGGSGDGR
jgi:acetate kinase